MPVSVPVSRNAEYVELPSDLPIGMMCQDEFSSLFWSHIVTCSLILKENNKCSPSHNGYDEKDIFKYYHNLILSSFQKQVTNNTYIRAILQDPPQSLQDTNPPAIAYEGLEHLYIPG